VTIKSIISIDVDDTQFMKFHALYKEYEASLASMPDNWKEIGGAINATATDFQKVAGGTSESMKAAAMQSAVLATGLKEAIKAQKEFHGTTQRSGSAMDKLVHSSAKLGHNIFGISKFLIKTAALSTGIFGGSLFGLGKLAAGAMNTQSAARGVGASTGQVKAFDLNFQNFLNPASTLQNIALAKTDGLGQNWLSQRTGLSLNQVMKTDAVTLAMKSTLALHDWAASLPNHGAMMAQNFPASGFDKLGFTLEDAIRLKNTPRSELVAAQKATVRDARTMQFGDKTAAQWVSLRKSLERAGVTIDTVLINKLAPLGPKLGHLARVVANSLADLIITVATKENIKKFSDIIQSVSDYMAKGDFQKNLAQLGQAIGDFASIVVAVAKWTGLDNSDSTPSTTSAPISSARKSTMAKGFASLVTARSVKSDWDRSSAQAYAVYEASKAKKDDQGFTASKAKKDDQGISRLVDALLKQKPYKPAMVTIYNNTAARVASSINSIGLLN